jgi:hypothetical protein
VVVGVVLLALPVIVFLFIFGGRLAFNIGGAADREAGAIARGGFLYALWARRYRADSVLYWRLVGFLLLFLAFGLCCLLVIGLLALAVK